MFLVLVATQHGLRAFTGDGERKGELAGRYIGAVSPEEGGGCLAVIDGHEIWRRDASGAWSNVAMSPIDLQSITTVQGCIFGGATEEGAIIRVTPNGDVERLKGFDHVSGRSYWFAGGPPLGVRSLTGNAAGAAVIAAVHVGGMPRSADGGETWIPTIPIAYDVHEVRSHPTLSNLVAAATAVGLCVSRDAGQNWSVLSEGLEVTNSLAVAVLEDEVLFGISDGPRASRSQVWRWKRGAKGWIESARDCPNGSTARLIQPGLQRVADELPSWTEEEISGSRPWDRAVGSASPSTCPTLSVYWFYRPRLIAGTD